MDTNPCPCGGENASCFRCFGTGLLAKSVPTVGRPHRNLAQAASEALDVKPNRSNPRPMAPADKAVPKVSRDGLGASKGRFTPFKPTLKLLPVKLASQKKGTYSHWQKQLAAASQTKRSPDGADRPQQQSSADKKSQIPRLPVLVKCPDCGVLVKRLERHQVKVHAVVGKSSRGKSIPRLKQMRLDGAKSDVKIKSKRVGSPVPNEPVRDDDVRLDAKHQWGHTFRDNGQFGSYPSHDDMDDESSP